MMAALIQRTSLLTIFCFALFLSQISFAQKKDRQISPEFQFEQIDSLTKNALERVKKTNSSLYVAYTNWYVGSYASPHHKYAAYSNAFEIYIFYSAKDKFYVEKIDNSGYFRRRQVKGRKVKLFLEDHFKQMSAESLKPKSDTSYNTKGEALISTTIIDHQLITYVNIFSGSESLKYEYPSNYSNNKINLETFRYKFLSIMDNTINSYNRK